MRMFKRSSLVIPSSTIGALNLQPTSPTQDRYQATPPFQHGLLSQSAVAAFPNQVSDHTTRGVDQLKMGEACKGAWEKQQTHLALMHSHSESTVDISF